MITLTCVEARGPISLDPNAIAFVQECATGTRLHLRHGAGLRHVTETFDVVLPLWQATATPMPALEERLGLRRARR